MVIMKNGLLIAMQVLAVIILVSGCKNFSIRFLLFVVDRLRVRLFYSLVMMADRLMVDWGGMCRRRSFVTWLWHLRVGFNLDMRFSMPLNQLFLLVSQYMVLWWHNMVRLLFQMWLWLMHYCLMINRDWSMHDHFVMFLHCGLVNWFRCNMHRGAMRSYILWLFVLRLHLFLLWHFSWLMS